MQGKYAICRTFTIYALNNVNERKILKDIKTTVVNTSWRNSSYKETIVFLL